MERGDWDELLDEARQISRPKVTSETFVKLWHTASQPVLLLCNDGQRYVVKGGQTGRMAVNDQIVGRLGMIAGTPTGAVALIEVPAELIAAEPQMQHMSAGTAHGSLWIPDCSERSQLEYTDVPDNRSRFAALALLFGWVGAGDPQFIYANTSPHLVYSVDHGHFFPSGPGWTVETLVGAAAPEPFSEIVAACGLTDAELAAASAAFRAVSDSATAEAVAAPPDAWGITHEERVAVASYLSTRRGVLFGV